MLLLLRLIGSKWIERAIFQRSSFALRIWVVSLKPAQTLMIVVILLSLVLAVLVEGCALKKRLQLHLYLLLIILPLLLAFSRFLRRFPAVVLSLYLHIVMIYRSAFLNKLYLSIWINFGVVLKAVHHRVSSLIPKPIVKVLRLHLLLRKTLFSLLVYDLRMRVVLLNNISSSACSCRFIELPLVLLWSLSMEFNQLFDWIFGLKTLLLSGHHLLGVVKSLAVAVEINDNGFVYNYILLNCSFLEPFGVAGLSFLLQTLIIAPVNRLVLRASTTLFLVLVIERSVSGEIDLILLQNLIILLEAMHHFLLFTQVGVTEEVSVWHVLSLWQTRNHILILVNPLLSNELVVLESVENDIRRLWLRPNLFHGLNLPSIAMVERLEYLFFTLFFLFL